MARYRMDIFKAGTRLGRRPRLWRRHDIFALDDGAAKVAAEIYYRGHAERLDFTSFSLCESGGGFVCEFPARISR